MTHVHSLRSKIVTISNRKVKLTACLQCDYFVKWVQTR